MKDRIPLGIGLGILAYSFFSVHDAANKWLVQFFPTFQVVAFRSSVVVLICLVIGRGRLLARALATPNKPALMARSSLTLCAWLLYYTAARHMPLAQLMTLYFSAPIITTVLAIRLLGETVSRGRWISLGLGFAGVLCASDPFGLRLSIHTAMVLAAACMWGYAIILMRQVSRQESSLLQMFYQNATFVAVTLPLTLADFVMPTGFQLVLLLAIGFLGGAGQYLMFEACRLAPASVMGTVEYTALFWAFLLGWLVFGDTPALPVTLGAVLIFSAGIYLFFSERQRRSA
jgi:drug/metabolite transporter (DMT)-like permease